MTDAWAQRQACRSICPPAAAPAPALLLPPSIFSGSQDIASERTRWDGSMRATRVLARVPGPAQVEARRTRHRRAIALTMRTENVATSAQP